MLTFTELGKKKVSAKFGEGSSVMAVGLCIGCPRLVGRGKTGKFSHKGFSFLRHPVQPLCCYVGNILSRRIMGV